MTDLDMMARELLADALSAEWPSMSADIRSGVKFDVPELAAIRAALLTAPPGYVLVPVEAAPEQLAAGQAAWLNDPMRRSSTLYRAMIAAAPGVK